MSYRALRKAEADAKALANYTQTPQIIVQHETRKTFHVIQADTRRDVAGVLVSEFLRKHGKNIQGMELGFQLKAIAVFTA